MVGKVLIRLIKGRSQQVKYDISTVFVREGLEKRAQLCESVIHAPLQSKDTGNEGHSRHSTSAHKRLNTNTWWAPFYKNEQTFPYLLIHYPQPPNTLTFAHTKKKKSLIK